MLNDKEITTSPDFDPNRKFGPALEVDQCPYCGKAKPAMSRLWHAIKPNIGTLPQVNRAWAVDACNVCGHAILQMGWGNNSDIRNCTLLKTYPETENVSLDIPERARRYLQQAKSTLHAPDAAVMVAGSAVDAMLKEKGLTEGSVYTRINEAVRKNILTHEMGEWAHNVRLGSNRPRHADSEDPHVTDEEAQQAVEFANALGQFLFELNARIKRGIKETSREEPKT